LFGSTDQPATTPTHNAVKEVTRAIKCHKAAARISSSRSLETKLLRKAAASFALDAGSQLRIGLGGPNPR